MKSSAKKHLRRTLLCALFAGSIAAPFAAQTAYALPIEGTHAATNADAASITTNGAVMDIVGKTDHNILKWEDFSIEQNEKVRFDNGTQTKDYLNLVTGEGASNIYGTIEGGRSIYLVNPHGILFAEGSQVNTGALYLSTANPADVLQNVSAFGGGSSPLSASTQYGNVLNLGTVKASKLYIEGKKVTVLNTDAVTNTAGNAPLTGANVTIRSEDAPHIGYDVANTTTRSFTINGATVSKTVSDYANANNSKSATSRGWDVKNLGGGAHGDYDYMRVHDVYELQHIEAKMDGRYILAGDIDATATQDWNSGVGFLPIGRDYDTSFTGRLDGVGHTLRGLYINRQDKSDIGLFGYAREARIENLSLVDGNVKGQYEVGGIVGFAVDTEIRNVSYAGTVDGTESVGGIVGTAYSASIQNAWNAGAITAGNKEVGGIVGAIANNSTLTLQYVWNAGTVTGGQRVGGIVGVIANGTSTLQYVWNAGTVTGGQRVGGIVGVAFGGTVRHAVSKVGSAGQAVGESSNGADVTTDVKVIAEADMKLAATYTDWKDERGDAVVATKGGVGTPWRIYEGYTMPLLTALMKGTKRLAKVYDGNVFATTDPHITLVHTGKDVGTYDAYSDQFGYDLIGGATIRPKALTLDLVNGTRFDKTYDGSDTVTQSLTKGTNYTLTGFVGSEGADVELAGAVTGTYADKNAGRDKDVTFQNLALTGTGAGNYTIIRARGVGTIAPKELNLALASGACFDKTYDGTANVTQSLTKDGNYTLTNFVNGEGADIALAPVTGTYTDKNAGTGKTVTFGGLTLTGTGAGNYVLNRTSLAGIGTISRCALTLGAVAAQSKTYDGNTLADASKFGAVLNNVVAGDSVTATAAGAAYNDKNVAGANAVNYTGVALAGADAGNYSLAETAAQGAGTIARRALTFDTVAAQTKTYDGNTNADAAQFHATLGNIVAGEESLVSATATGAAYNDKNVAAANTVGYTGVVLGGTGAGNYSIANTAQGTGTISQRTLTLSSVAGQTFDKVYDGTTNAAADTLKKGGNYILSNFADGEGDGITVTGTGSYADKNVGTRAVNYTGLTLTGSGAGNYRLNTATLAGTGAITHRTLTLIAAPQSIVQGETLPSFTGHAEGFANGENESVFGADGITFDSAVTSTDTAGSYGVTGRIGSTSEGILGNYRITQAAGNANAFTIHAAALPGGILAALVQNSAPRFDMGFGDSVYLFGMPRPVPTATLGIYRFATARDVNIEGVRLD